MDWAQVREAVCDLYAPESVTDLPEPAEDAPVPAAQEVPAQEETAEAPDPGSAFQFEFQEMPTETAGEEAPEEETHPAPEEATPPEEPARETPFCRHGWEFARVTLPAACGFDHAYVGAPLTGTGEICLAIPAGYTPEPPLGLEDYQWSGGTGLGWWLKCYVTDSPTQ